MFLLVHVHGVTFVLIRSKMLTLQKKHNVFAQNGRLL